ncbi:LysM domain-containing protein [Nitrosomonas sp.]|uniref:LysM domain-containing protein n=1 Tax=Nitrosomonas sp. TaxID=42353 RepID=UPI0025F442DA|nr:LysM domain-containing protein [Nitrosomonas sp.]
MTTYNFPATSRYYDIETVTLQTVDDRTVVYLRRRFLPAPDRFALLQEHVVSQGERLDQVSASFQGDPEAFWRIADANAAMRPEALTEEIGRRLRITLPEGIPGLPNA